MNICSICGISISNDKLYCNKSCSKEAKIIEARELAWKKQIAEYAGNYRVMRMYEGVRV